MIWLLADVGSIGGGWISSYMIKNGRSVNYSRKFAMTVCAILVLPVVFAPMVSNMWMATMLIGLAMASHQGFSANQYTLVSDMFPRAAVASVAGMGGSAGYFGATIMSFTTGLVLTLTKGSYVLPFAVASVSYLIAMAIINHYAPKLDPIELPPEMAFPVILNNDKPQ